MWSPRRFYYKLALGDLQILLETPQGQRTVNMSERETSRRIPCPDCSIKSDDDREMKCHNGKVAMCSYLKLKSDNASLHSRVKELEQQARGHEIAQDIADEQLSAKAEECERLRGALNLFDVFSSHHAECDECGDEGCCEKSEDLWDEAEAAMKKAISASEKTTGPGRLNDL